MVVDDDDYDDDVWDDATEGWKGLKGWGSNGKWCIIHKIDYILTIVTDWLSDETESWDAIASKKLSEKGLKIDKDQDPSLPIVYHCQFW